MSGAAVVPLVLQVRCHYCSKFRSPREIISIGTGGASMCWHCYEWHGRALEVLCTGKPPAGCQVCGVTFARLQAALPAGDLIGVRMFIHQKDGIYQVLCRACSDGYVVKRPDLYRPTKFGHDQKI